MAKSEVIKYGSVVVKLYPTGTKKYPAWTVVWYEALVRQRKKFSDKTEALGFADRTAKAIAHQEDRALTDIESRSYLRAQEILGRTPVELAAVEYAEAKERLAGVPLLRAVEFYLKHNPKDLTRKTTLEVYNELILSKRQAKRSKYHVRDLENRLERFVDSFPGAISDLTGSEIDDWLAKQNGGGRNKNNIRDTLVTFFNYAKARHYLPENWNEISAVTTYTETKGKFRTFSPVEISKMIKKSLPHQIPFLAIGAFAGVRHEELKRLDWSKLRDGFIHLDHDVTKTGSRRLVPILPNLRKILKKHWKKEGPVCTYANMTNEMVHVAEAAGVTWIRNGPRRSFISYRLAQTNDVAKVAWEAGTSARKIQENYLGLRTPKEAKAWFSVS